MQKDCLNCGHANLSQSQFCERCGASLGTSRPQRRGISKTTLTIGAVAVVCIVGFWILAIIAGSREAKEASRTTTAAPPAVSIAPPPTPTATPSPSSFTVVEKKMLNDALIYSVKTTATDEAMTIARSLIESEPGTYHMIRVFVYSPSMKVGDDRPAHRIEWTRRSGYVQNY